MLLLDNSAWSRIVAARLPADRAGEVAGWIEERRLATAAAEKRALQAQQRLAVIGHYRLSPVDIMIAACAGEAGAGVLHYDRDYDLIAEHTHLSFGSVWLAEAGTL